MNAHVTISLTGEKKKHNTLWLNMEQEEIPEQNEHASTKDVLEMLGIASGGTSAFSYLASRCPYVSVEESTVVITLAFYVWPADLAMPYTLEADLGTISEGSASSLYKSFDAVLDGTSSVGFDFLFEGTSSRSIPFFLLNGDTLRTDAEEEIEGHELTTAVDGYCVYRINGKAIGYRHIITMVIPKAGAQKVTNLQNVVLAEWYDDEGELNTTSLPLEFPQCVKDALLECDDGTLAYDSTTCGGKCDKDKQRLDVYISGCDGETVLDEHWVENT